MRLLSSALCVLFLIGCEAGQKEDKDMNYSFACLDSAISGSELNKTLEKAGDLIRDFGVDENSITDQVQNQYGALFHKDALENKTFVLLNDPRMQSDLEVSLADLLKVRQDPSAIDYKIYAVDDTTVNAFTFGGRIYITKAMYSKCRGRTALLYAIIGHEIGHSEMGHIKKTIQEMELANKVFGEQNGMTAYQVIRLITGSFNQRNELEADYYGTDLTYRLNQDICAAVEFWKEMSRSENEYNRLEDFFRTHPFSSLRAKCLETHIAANFGNRCSSTP